MNQLFHERRERNMPEKIIHHFETPPTGGYLTYHWTFKYPKKGFVNEYVIQTLNFAKRLTITWIRFFGNRSLIPFYLLFIVLPKKRIIERLMEEYCNAAEFFLQTYQHKYYLDIQYYTEISKELNKLLVLFFKYLGISPNIAGRLAFIFASFIEYDTAYRYSVEDLFSESSSEKMINNPRQEINRLVLLYIQRTKKKDLSEKFKSIGRILNWLLYIPNVKKAFIKAIKEIDFTKLQFDEIDRYQIRNASGYDYFGMIKKERDIKWPMEDHTVLFPDYEHLSDQDLHNIFITP